MNTTVNGSGCSSLLNPQAARIAQTVGYSVISAVSLVGNSFIGIIVYKTQTLRKPINFFIVNMAMSDLLYSISLFPRHITYLYADSSLISGHFGQTLCKLTSFLSYVSTGVSIQGVLLIAVDRFGAVLLPLRSPLISSKACPFFILASWIVAMAINSPVLFATMERVEYQGQLTCVSKHLNMEAFANYVLVMYVVCLHIPIFLVAVLYSIIFIKLKSGKIPGEHSTYNARQREQRHRNVLKMAIAIVFGMVLCLLPWSVFHILFAFSWNSRLYCAMALCHFVALFLAQANSAINPCICFIFSQNYRQGLKKLLKCSETLPSNNITPKA